MNQPEILFEDNHLLIVNKKWGDLVQGDKTGDVTLLEELKDFIKKRDNKPGNVFLGLTHRLDRPTSGIVIYAKTSKALTRMNDKFRNQEISKTYWAITTPLQKDVNQQDKLVHYLKKNQKNNLVTVFKQPTPEAKIAILHYQLIQKLDNYDVLEITLETGRSHQIRAQLSKIGSPVKGDLKYGSPRSNKHNGILLHARKVQFEHPITKELIEIIAPTPDEVLWNLVK